MKTAEDRPGSRSNNLAVPVLPNTGVRSTPTADVPVAGRTAGTCPACSSTPITRTDLSRAGSADEAHRKWIWRTFREGGSMPLTSDHQRWTKIIPV
ncbi:hypothetical protein [Rhodococcus aetherivorans]